MSAATAGSFVKLLLLEGNFIHLKKEGVSSAGTECNGSTNIPKDLFNVFRGCSHGT